MLSLVPRATVIGVEAPPSTTAIALQTVDRRDGILVFGRR